MEKTVRIISQTGATTRSYTDKRTGEQKTMTSRSFRLTDGVDTFVAEMTGEKALNCPTLDVHQLYRVQCTMVTREWTSQNGEANVTNCIYLDKINVV
jgi:hypothetical protein